MLRMDLQHFGGRGASSGGGGGGASVQESNQMYTSANIQAKNYYNSFKKPNRNKG